MHPSHTSGREIPAIGPKLFEDSVDKSCDCLVPPKEAIFALSQLSDADFGELRGKGGHSVLTASFLDRATLFFA